MAKRFTTQEKWDNLWYRKLSPVNKCFFEYLYTRCNYSGIWDVDFETAEHYIGAKLNVEEIKKMFEGKYYELDNGTLWFLPDFIKLQHKGKLNPENMAQKKAYAELLEIGLIDDSGTLRLLPSSLGGAKEEDKAISKEKDKSINKEIVIDKNVYKDKAENIEEELTKEVIKRRTLTDNTTETLKHPNDASPGMEYDFYGKPIYR